MVRRVQASAIFCAAALVSAHMAAATEPPAPAAQSVSPEQFSGKIGGLEAYRVPQSQTLLFRDPVTGNSIVGLAFDADGNRITLFAGERPGHDATPEKLAITLPETELKSLVTHLRGVKSQAEFDAAIRNWKNGVPDADAKTAPDPAPSVARLPTKPGDESLYIALSGAKWISFGPDGAPPVYLLSNGNCEGCAAAWRKLFEPAKAGKIQLRLILAPTSDANMDFLIAAASSPRLPEILSKGAIEAQSPKSDAPAERIARISENLAANLKMAKGFSLGLPPVIAYESKKGARYFRTAPETPDLLDDIELP